MGMLRTEMHKLVEDVSDYVRRHRGVEHQALCVKVADEFDLWEKNGGVRGEDEWYFPVWLSRVCEGIMRDVSEQE